MACTDVFDAFRVATEDLDKDVHFQAAYQSIWLNLIRRGRYTLGTGLTHSVFAIQKQEPTTDEETWEAITLATGTGEGACANNFTDVDFGFKELTYAPERFQLRGPVICRKDLLFSYNVGTFLEGYIHEMAIAAQRRWEKRYETLHIQNSRKVVANANLPMTDQTGYTGLEDTSCRLTQDMLDKIGVQLIRDGATNPDDRGFITFGESGPIFSLYIGPEASHDILVNNADFRQDNREGNLRGANPILARMGATLVIKNFRHVINLYPPRYTRVGNDYVRVNTWDTESGTKGDGSVVRAAWESAPYEGALVLSSDLFTSEIVPPLNSVAGQSFDPQTYMGEWAFEVGAYKWDTDCPDPFGDKGRHFAQFYHAPKPNPVGRFRYGYWIVFRRCLDDATCETCESSS